MSPELPRTRWAFAPPWLRGSTPAAAEAGDPALLALLQRDLARRHHGLAVRHYLMLCGLGAALPPALSDRCEALLAACTARRRQSLERAVAQWLRERRGFCGAGHNPQPLRTNCTAAP